MCRAWLHARLDKPDTNREARSPDGTILLANVKHEQLKRTSTGFRAFDLCLGGGLLDTTVGLLGGEPGAGKSTASLQIACYSAAPGNQVMYVGAEEPESVIRLRADRLALPNLEHVRIFPPSIIGQTDLAFALRAHKTRFMVLDSLQGFCGQDMRAQVNLAHAIKALCMELGILAIIITHINKGESFAGLMDLQHEVDWTALLRSTGDGEVRELYTEKNRGGVGHVSRELLMTAQGLWEPCGELDKADSERLGLASAGRAAVERAALGDRLIEDEEAWTRAVYERAGLLDDDDEEG